MLTDEQLKKVRFASVSHTSMSTYYVSTYKSINLKPVVWMHVVTPREILCPEEYSASELQNRPKKRQKQFRTVNYTCGRFETLNKHVPLTLIEVL